MFELIKTHQECLNTPVVKGCTIRGLSVSHIFCYFGNLVMGKYMFTKDGIHLTRNAEAIFGDELVDTTVIMDYLYYNSP